jgi:hypothetical protein
LTWQNEHIDYRYPARCSGQAGGDALQRLKHRPLVLRQPQAAVSHTLAPHSRLAHLHCTKRSAVQVPSRRLRAFPSTARHLYLRYWCRQGRGGAHSPGVLPGVQVSVAWRRRYRGWLSTKALLKIYIEGTCLRCKDLRYKVKKEAPKTHVFGVHVGDWMSPICMSVERLELSTNGLKGRCSTIELHARRGSFYHAGLHASIATMQPQIRLRQVLPHSEVQVTRGQRLKKGGWVTSIILGYCLI